MSYELTRLEGNINNRDEDEWLAIYLMNLNWHRILLWWEDDDDLGASWECCGNHLCCCAYGKLTVVWRCNFSNTWISKSMTVWSITWMAIGSSNSNLGNNCLGNQWFFVNCSLESVDGISCIFNSSTSTISFNKSVWSSYNISITCFTLCFVVSGDGISDRIWVRVLWVWIVISNGFSNNSL